MLRGPGCSWGDRKKGWAGGRAAAQEVPFLELCTKIAVCPDSGSQCPTREVRVTKETFPREGPELTFVWLLPPPSHCLPPASPRHLCLRLRSTLKS